MWGDKILILDKLNELNQKNLEIFKPRSYYWVIVYYSVKCKEEQSS